MMFLSRLLEEQTRSLEVSAIFDDAECVLVLHVHGVSTSRFF